VIEQSEHSIQSSILKHCQRPGIRLIRINSGSTSHRVKGAPAGTSDLIGWKDGIFVAIEVKKPGKDATPLQQAFLDDVKAAGGISGVARSVEEAVDILGIGG
jgi:hypothetical protein